MCHGMMPPCGLGKIKKPSDRKWPKGCGDGERLSLGFNQGLILGKYQEGKTLLWWDVAGIMPGGIPGKMPGWFLYIFNDFIDMNG